MIKRLFWKYLPRYLRLPGTLIWFAMWSAPTTPATTWNYFKSWRITIRHGEAHSRIFLVLKRGTTD